MLEMTSYKGSDDEYILLGGMIMLDSVLSTCYAKYKSNILKTKHFSPHYRPVFQWLVKYYADYQKAPKSTIQKIFDRKSKNIQEESVEVIETALDRVAEEYVENDSIEPQFIIKEVLISFLREREISDKLEKVQSKLDAGDPDGAEEIYRSYSPISAEDEDDSVIQVFSKEDVKQDWDSQAISGVYRFDGDLGKIIGPLEKSWLVAVTGIEKVGKSYFLGEIAYQAAIRQKRKVLMMNFELNNRVARSRARRRISQTAMPFNAGRIVFPILDCENNQYGTCKLKRKKPLFKKDNEVVYFLQHRKTWKVCTQCMDRAGRKNAARTKRYVPTIWFARDRFRVLNKMRFKRALRDNKYFGLNNLRIKCFPRFSKTFDETRDFILRYIEKSQWKPEILIYDYLDILASEGYKDERINIDRSWKKASRLAGELDCLLITADQANKAGRTQRSLDQMSTSESKTKDSHLDVRIAINQTKNEHDLQLARIAVLFHRHAPFSLSKEVMVTQRFATADAFMENAAWHLKTDTFNVSLEKGGGKRKR
ncbi:hypothetical protein AYK24_06635 [Thermoplasmatales archaeon SG8-52-4]|nr:MAG: hypothetical protein AYK24_06635 [Thermoplasmatales archaeon SG8-52-4]